MAHIEAEGEIRTYTIIVKGEAQEIEKENLWLKIAFTAEKNMVAILDRLGLTPHNRAKIKPTAEPDRKPVDEFDEFLAPRRTTPRPAMTPIAVPDSTPEIEL
jgi:phage terminase small subunit